MQRFYDPELTGAMAGIYDAFTTTGVNSMGSGSPNAGSFSGTSAGVVGMLEAVADDGLYVTIEEVDAMGSGDSSTYGYLGSTDGSTFSASDSAILDLGESADTFSGSIAIDENAVLSGGFDAASGFMAGLATSGVWTRPGEGSGDLDAGQLAVEVEHFTVGIGSGLAAALEVEGGEVLGAGAGGLGKAQQVADAEAMVKPGGIFFYGVREVDESGMGEFGFAVGEGDAAAAAIGFNDQMLTFDPMFGEPITDSISIDLFTESDGRAQADASTPDYSAVLPLQNGYGEIESEGVATLDGFEGMTTADYSLPAVTLSIFPGP